MSETEYRRVATWHPFLAGLLSWIIPGLGQMYKGEVARGAVFLFWYFVILFAEVAVVLFYADHLAAVGFAVLLYLGFWLLVVADAAMERPFWRQ